jgi:hypothetical protein
MGHWGRPHTDNRGQTVMHHYPTPTWCKDPGRYIKDHDLQPDTAVTLHQPGADQGGQCDTK